MNPQGFSLLYIRRHRTDHRSPLRREDEMPLHFLVSNTTYRLVMAAEQWLKRANALRTQYWPPHPRN